MDSRPPLRERKIIILAGGILLLLAVVFVIRAWGLISPHPPAPTPSMVVQAAAQASSTPDLPATQTPAPPAVTATVVLPQPTPPESSLPEEFLARLALGRVEAFGVSPQMDRLAAASDSHTCLFLTAGYSAPGAA